MRRFLTIVVCSLMFAAAAQAVTTYFVDVNYTGGLNDGSQAHPFTSMPWTQVNAALATGAVTVNFSARVPGTTTPAISLTAISLGSRTNTSSNVLTLDGSSFYNSGTASVPAWSTNASLAPCLVRDMNQVPTGPDWNGFTTGCSWFNALKFQVRAGVPISGNDNVNNCVGNFVVQGFSFQATNGQSGDLTYIHDITIQYNEFTRVALGSNGPGLYVGPGQHGPCNASTSNAGGPDNVTVQYNYIHDEWGECIYEGATTSDPPGGPGNAEYIANGMTCTTNCNTGANHLIKGNTIQSCAAWSGQGDGIDFKDGHANSQIVQNSIWTTKPAACTTWATACAGSSGADGQGIVMESGAVVDSNYIKKSCPQGGCTDHEGIAVFDSWNNATGRKDSLRVSNNIVADIHSAIGHNNGIEAQPLQTGATQTWNTWSVYSNSVFSTNDPCVTNSNSIGTGGPVENNICSSTGGSISGAPVGTHDFNIFFGAGGCPAGEGAHSICNTDPKFVSTSTPLAAANFQVQGTSSTISAATNLASTFTNDFFANIRPTLASWTMGASEFNTSSALTPTFSPVAGNYLGSQSVTISTASAGAIICYNTTGSPSTNGSTGCSTGTLYSGAVTVSTSQTLFAVAGGTGFADSTVGSAAYTINPSMKMSGVTTMSGSAVIQ